MYIANNNNHSFLAIMVVCNLLDDASSRSMYCMYIDVRPSPSADAIRDTNGTARRSVRAVNGAGGRTVMREAAGRMAELEFEAPLAQIEEADDCLSTADYPQKTINGNDIRLNNINNLKNDMIKIQTDSNKINDNDEPRPVKCKQDNMQNCEGDNFTETFSGSLEDLVNTFDEKITKCFGNYEESVEKLAPVQVRSQEEIMSECQ